jgi:hypothetical protein
MYSKKISNVAMICLMFLIMVSCSKTNLNKLTACKWLCIDEGEFLIINFEDKDKVHFIRYNSVTSYYYSIEDHNIKVYNPLNSNTLFYEILSFSPDKLELRLSNNANISVFVPTNSISNNDIDLTHLQRLLINNSWKREDKGPERTLYYNFISGKNAFFADEWHKRDEVLYGLMNWDIKRYADLIILELDYIGKNYFYFNSNDSENLNFIFFRDNNKFQFPLSKNNISIDEYDQISNSLNGKWTLFSEPVDPRIKRINWIEFDNQIFFYRDTYLVTGNWYLTKDGRCIFLDFGDVFSKEQIFSYKIDEEYLELKNSETLRYKKE